MLDTNLNNDLCLVPNQAIEAGVAAVRHGGKQDVLVLSPGQVESAKRGVRALASMSSCSEQLTGERAQRCRVDLEGVRLVLFALYRPQHWLLVVVERGDGHERLKVVDSLGVDAAKYNIQAGLAKRYTAWRLITHTRLS